MLLQHAEHVSQFSKLIEKQILKHQSAFATSIKFISDLILER